MPYRLTNGTVPNPSVTSSRVVSATPATAVSGTYSAYKSTPIYSSVSSSPSYSPTSGRSGRRKMTRSQMIRMKKQRRSKSGATAASVEDVVLPEDEMVFVEEEESALPSWALPVAGAAVLGLGAWLVFGRRG